MPLTSTHKTTPTTDVIATGYKWICAACTHLNTEFELYSIFTCEACETDHELGNLKHAWH